MGFEMQVVNDLLDRMYPWHIRVRLHELPGPVRPPVPHQASGSVAALHCRGRIRCLEPQTF